MDTCIYEENSIDFRLVVTVESDGCIKEQVSPVIYSDASSLGPYDVSCSASSAGMSALAITATNNFFD